MQLLEDVRSVFERRRWVSLAYLFGSRARGDAREDRDFDFAVLASGRPRGWGVGELQAELVKVLNTADDKVDVLLLNDAPLDLAYKAISEGVLVFERSREERVRYEEWVLRMYLDFKPSLERYYRTLVRRLVG